MDRATFASFAERSVDSEPTFSTQEFLTRLYIRKWMLVLWIIIPTALSLTATALTPQTYLATTKILIRYSSTESAFLRDLIPDNRTPLSGAVSSEILRSLPTLVETIRRYHIEESDLYRESSKVVFGKLASYLPFGSHHADTADNSDMPGVDAKTVALARIFQDSLEESSKTSSSALAAKARPVELLDSDSSVPQSLKGDEFITVTVRAFNRDKVAEITNGLAETFIDQYYQISADDAHRAYEFLSSLVAKSEADVQQLERDPQSAAAIAGDSRIGGGDNAISRDSPAIAKLTDELATLQTELGHYQQVYKDDSPKIQRAVAEIANIKQLLGGQERLDVAKQVLQEIKSRRFQALNTENLYRERLVPISIVEPAVTPARSASANIMRFVVSGITGLLVGGVLGLALAVIFGLIDSRLFTPADVERKLRLPVFGWVPRVRLAARRRETVAAADQRAVASAGRGLQQVLAHLDAARVEGAGNVVAIASVNDRDGKSVTALLLAHALARAGRSRVLLIDADLPQASVSHHFGQQDAAGLADSVLAARPVAELIVTTGTANLDLLPAGSAATRKDAGLSLRRLKHVFNEVRRDYDVIVVDSPSIAVSSQALICGMAADTVLVVVKSGVTRAPQVQRLLRKLQEMAASPQGVILNFQTNALPRFAIRNV